MSKNYYVFDHSNHIFSFRKVYVVTLSVNGEEARPVACCPTESEAKAVAQTYLADTFVDYDDNGDPVKQNITANYYPLSFENDDLWLGEKITGYINAAAEKIGTFTDRMKYIVTAVRKPFSETN